METNTIKNPICPIAQIDLKKDPRTLGSYLVYNQRGFVASSFLGVHKRLPHKGIPFLALEDKCKYNRAMADRYNFFIYTTNTEAVRRKRLEKPNATRALITGFNFDLEFPNRAYGDGGIYNDHGGDALLMEFDNRREKFTIWIFKDAKFYARSLFERWNAGNLVMVVKDDVTSYQVHPVAISAHTPLSEVQID